MYKHPVYTRPANRWSHLQRGIGCQAHPLLSNRLTRNHGVHSCSRNRVETRFVVVIVGTAIFTWKRLRYVEGTRHPEAASVGTGPRSSDGRPVASILHRGGARIATTWANRATARDNPGKETRRFSPRFFRNDFFARDRPSNPVTSFQVRNRVKASVINAPWLFLFFFFFCLFAFFIYIYIFLESFI